MWNATRTQPCPRRVHRASIAVGALICAVAIAACGGSATSSTATAASNRFLAFSQCMRSHGLPNFPDPSSGGGIKITPGSGINLASPAFKAAQSACRKLMPGGGPGGHGPPSAQAKAQMLAISKCMRAHGLTGFPDPTTTPPASPSGYSQVIGREGIFLAVPQTINTASPVYKQAAAACQFGSPAAARKSPSP
jgi:hypothetical protein